jgi:hypothetical protein
MYQIKKTVLNNIRRNPMVNAKDNPSKSPIEVHFVATVALPYTLRLPDEIYNCKYGRNEFAIETHLIEENLGEAQESKETIAEAGKTEKQGIFMFQAKTGKLTSAEGAHIPGAMLRYTIIKVGIGRRLPGPEITKTDTLSVRNSVHKYINHFLDHYRYIAGDDTIHQLSRSELHQVRAGQAFHFIYNYVTAGHGKMGMGVMFDETDPISVGDAQTISDDKLAVFKEKLRASQKVLLPNLLLLNARGYIRSGETRFAIIDMNTALDIVVEQKALECLLANGKKTEEAKANLAQKSTSKIVKTILLPLIPTGDRPDKDWEEWYNIHRVLRNKVIHDGYAPTEDEAMNSLENLEKLCAYFLSLSRSST